MSIIRMLYTYYIHITMYIRILSILHAFYYTHIIGLLLSCVLAIHFVINLRMLDYSTIYSN